MQFRTYLGVLRPFEKCDVDKNSYACKIFPVIKLIAVFYAIIYYVFVYIVFHLHSLVNSSKKVKIFTILLDFTILSWCFCFVCPHIAHFHNRSDTVVLV